ncbi:MAG: ATP-binding protein [Myxococcales bacterium]
MASPLIEDLATRRKSQLLSAGLLIMTSVFMVVDTTYLLTSPNYTPPYYGYVFLLGSYALNLMGRYRAAVTTVFAMLTIVPVAHVSGLGAAYPQMSLSYLALGPCLGATLLSVRGVALLCGINLAALWLTPHLGQGTITTALLVGPMSLTAVAGLLALLSMLHRGHLERDRLHELAESEQRLRMALEAARMGIFDVDARSGKAITTPGVARMLGLGPGAAMDHYQRYRKSIHPEDLAGLEAALEQPTGPEGQVLSLSHRVIWPDGSVHWLDASGRAIFDAQGRVVRRMGTLVDVTDKKLLEEQLRQVQKLEAVGRLAGGVAHDFNNLLTVILGNIELLKLHKHTNALHDIEQAALSAATLTQQLLAFSRRAMINPQVVMLDEALKKTTKMLERIIGEDVRTQLVLCESPWSTRVDEGQIQQIVLNLATNARDAMPQGGLLTISTENASLSAEEARRFDGARAGDYVLLSVKDTGAGMSAETITRVFEPFFTTKPAGKGTGLGLAMVFGLVAQSEGFIAVDSVVGMGTTFKLFFPRAPVRESRPPKHLERAPDTGSETLLLVEDEAGVRDVTKSLLELAGYSVLAAQSPDAAKRVWSEYKHRIALVITDVVMPEGSGHELAAALRAQRPDLPVLFITGYDPTSGDEDADGPTLPKPFTREELLAQVRRMLDQHAIKRSAAGARS